MKLPLLLIFTLCLGLALPALAETVKDREGAVRHDRAAMENDARWIYSDWQRGFEEARRTGKPLLVVLRCVPCLACAGIDAQVLLHETDLAPLLDQFVCVRVINANAIDLARFQFDFDLSFTTMFFNGDGTTYGRYGSWMHQKNAQEKSTTSFRRALEAALALHHGYPANKAALAGKQAVALPYKTPVEIPSLGRKYALDLDWTGKLVQSCVHCHQIGDAIRLSFRENKQPIPAEWIYPQPIPETIGLTLATDDIARIEAVAPGSPAAQAGLKAGDDLTTLGGQPLLSIADVSWALNRAPGRGTLAAIVQRGGKAETVNLNLPADWRTKADISRRVSTWPLRGMAFGGLKLDDLDDSARSAHSLGAKAMALSVNSVGQYGKHAAAKNAGFQKDDLIVGIDGLDQRLTEGELLGHLLQKHPIGDQVSVTVLRGSERLTLSLPMQ